MESFLKAIFPCLPIRTVERGIQLPAESTNYQYMSEKAALHPSPHNDKKSRLRSDEAASSIVSAMWDADKIGPSLDATIQSLVHEAGGWSEYLGKKILAALEAVIEAGKPMNAAMQETYEKAWEEAKKIEGLAADHPVVTAIFLTVVALGVLVVVAPYVVEWLGFWSGFGELGPVEGSWAAVWQSTYRGLVPKGSLFSYFQRLGMTWKRV